jgi:hypothetical protein
MKNLEDSGSTISQGYEFRGFTISPHMLEAVNRYVRDGDMPGDFLTAVICNDLREAIARADDHNQVNLPAYIAYLHNEAPGQCWGSREKMNAWIKARQNSTIRR